MRCSLVARAMGKSGERQIGQNCTTGSCMFSCPDDISFSVLQLHLLCEPGRIMPVGRGGQAWTSSTWRRSREVEGTAKKLGKHKSTHLCHSIEQLQLYKQQREAVCQYTCFPNRKKSLIRCGHSGGSCVQAPEVVTAEPSDIEMEPSSLTCSRAIVVWVLIHCVCLWEWIVVISSEARETSIHSICLALMSRINEGRPIRWSCLCLTLLISPDSASSSSRAREQVSVADIELRRW